MQMNLFMKQKQTENIENRYVVAKTVGKEGLIGNLGLAHANY